MDAQPFDVHPFRFESGGWAQRITLQNPGSDRPWRLLVCTVDGERDAQTMSNGLLRMLQRAYDAGRASVDKVAQSEPGERQA